MKAVRIGILGAARIVPTALIKPAQQVAEVTATAIAARDITRAQAFAKKHQIPHVFASYDELLNDPTIDAVYIPLPNSLHGLWTIRALEAGKHVLCEKPLASNAVEAERIVQAGQQSGLVLMEAFHYRYHPLAARMKEIVSSGELGTLRRIEASLCIPILSRNDIQYNLTLGGGATMAVGSYPINLLRFLSGEQPEVVQAKVKLASPGVDRRMDVDLRFPSGTTGHIRASLFSSDLLRISTRITGDQGHMSVLNYVVPHAYHRLTVKTAREHRTEHVAGDASYTYQLRAFVQAINEGSSVLTNANDAIANIRVIDAIYHKAGLRPRTSAEDSPRPTPIAK